MASDGKKQIKITTRPRQSSTDSDSELSLKPPRAARFAEATSVCSPIEPSDASKAPFAEATASTNHYRPQPQPSDVGFGYLAETDSQRQSYLGVGQDVEMPQTPRSPLKSALKSPGAPSRNLETVLSPTFQQEEILERQERMTEKEQAHDLKVKTRVRMAKFLLRGVNFGCSLIILSMLSSTFTIFNATRALPARNNVPAWAPTTQTWPQITLLVVACVSLVLSLIVFWAYRKGAHKQAQKAAFYYSTFAIAFFLFNLLMWGFAAGVLHLSKANGNGNDIWGWSCKDNTRKQLFQNQVHYALVCRFQNWSLLCAIIEIIIETITITVYGVVFYRYWSKRKLRKSMAKRDTARSDLYLAHLRSQSAPNTPGFKPLLSPGSGGWIPPADHQMAPPRSPYAVDPYSKAEMGQAEGVQYASVPPQNNITTQPFALRPPPIRIHAPTPRADQGQWSPATPVPPTPASPAVAYGAIQNPQEHVPAAPGEVQYATVPIPQAYASPLESPSFVPAQVRQGGFPGV